LAPRVPIIAIDAIVAERTEKRHPISRIVNQSLKRYLWIRNPEKGDKSGKKSGSNLIPKGNRHSEREAGLFSKGENRRGNCFVGSLPKQFAVAKDGTLIKKRSLTLRPV